MRPVDREFFFDVPLSSSVLSSSSSQSGFSLSSSSSGFSSSSHSDLADFAAALCRPRRMRPSSEGTEPRNQPFRAAVHSSSLASIEEIRPQANNWARTFAEIFIAFNLSVSVAAGAVFTPWGTTVDADIAATDTAFSLCDWMTGAACCDPGRLANVSVSPGTTASIKRCWIALSARSASPWPNCATTVSTDSPRYLATSPMNDLPKESMNA